MKQYIKDIIDIIENKWDQNGGGFGFFPYNKKGFGEYKYNNCKEYG